ncbi:MAG TPA: cytochrome c [Lysobacter sp.]|nr:cytochrome c [Lysobacter sp.]
MKLSSIMLGVIIAFAALLATAAGFVWSGVYDVAADAQHTRPVHSLLQTLRERSIAARTDDLVVPSDLSDPARIRQGAGNYNAMCMGCHLAPGMADTELSKGLYPSPPNLSLSGVDAAAAFWVIKHGIKASGMPAWGQSMGDEYIWNMAAFLQALPELDAGGYDVLVASSGGHEHGGGETIEHAHAESAPPGGDVAQQNRGTSEAATPEPATIEHRHADGTVESHPAPSSPPADDGHDDHQH